MSDEIINRYFAKQVMKFTDGDHVFFISDPHFFHEAIIRFCNRPFKDVHEMNDTLIRNWNNKVGKDDTVFILGDFCFGGSGAWSFILNNLNGRKHLLIGNHDMKNLRQGFMKLFDSVSFQQSIYVGDQFIYLNHFPFLCYAGSYRKQKPVWQLFGHLHSQDIHYNIEDIEDPEVKEILKKDFARLKYLFPYQYDVGVDKNNFTPISFNEVKEKIDQQVIEYNKKLKENETQVQTNKSLALLISRVRNKLRRLLQS